MSNERKNTEFDDAGLDAFFAAARATETIPTEAFMARVLADAAALQPAGAVLAAPAATRPTGILATLRAVFAGGAPMAGLIAAGLAGVWFGFAMPLESVADFGLSASAQTLDFFPTAIEDWTEVLELASDQED